MGAEDLYQRDLERGDLAMQEDTSQIKLNLEANVDIRSVDCRRPPEGEATVRNLVQTRALGVSELLKFHALLKATSALPEQSLPRGEGSSFEERMFENGLDSAEGLNDIRTLSNWFSICLGNEIHAGGTYIGIQVPKFAIMSLACPVKGIGLH